MGRLFPTVLLLTLFALQAAVLQEAQSVISGRLLSADGRPAANVRVALSPAAEDDVLLQITHTDNAGRYRMEGVPAGQYHIVAGALGRQTYFPGVDGSAEAAVVLVRAGSVAEIEIPEFQLQPASVAVFRVIGRLTGPLPFGRKISLLLDRLGSSPADRQTNVNVAPDGSFEVSELQPGTYEVYLSDRVVATFAVTNKDITDLSIYMGIR